MLSIIGLAAQAPRRWRPLSSNVRPHEKLSMSMEVPGHRSHDQMQDHAWQQFSGRSLSALKANAFTAIVVASMNAQAHRTEKDDAVSSPPAHSAGRPSAGGRLTTDVPRVKNSEVPSRNAAAVCANRPTPQVARSNLASAQQPSVPQASQPAQDPRVRPNPSLERTSTGMALGPRGAQVYAAPRGPSALPVASAQLKR